MFHYIRNVYKQFKKLYQIKKHLELIHLELPRHNTIVELYPEFEKLKTLIFDCGSLYVKFLQWYISKLKSNTIKSDTLESRNTNIFINYFEDIFENCPFHSLDDTKIIFENAMPGYTLETYIDITTLRELASGSIGQVYYARRKSDNLEVAIKVKHPDIAVDLENQLALIKLIKFLQSFDYIRKRFNLIFNVDDFLNDIVQQCDFHIEAENNKRFRENFKDSQEFIIFPEIIFQSEDVLVSHYIPGESIDTLTPVQQFNTTLSFVCFFYQMFLVDNFIHGDLHCKNWKIRIPPSKNTETMNNTDIKPQIKPQLVIYDCGICFKNINVELSNNFWFSIAKYDLEKLKDTMTQFITINNIQFSQEDINNEITTLFNSIMKDSVSTALFLKLLLSFFTSRNIMVHKFLLNFTILLYVIEEFLTKGDIINRESEDSKKINMFDLITDNQLDIISFCHVNKCYPRVAELFQKEMDNKYLEYQKNIISNNIIENNEVEPQLFSSIALSRLTFRPPE